MEYTGSKLVSDEINEKLQSNGTYTFPTGTRYEGEFWDGQFHGHGILFFKDGSKFEGDWDLGENLSGDFTFADGLTFKEDNWEYCDGYDRRFYTEILDGMQPAGKSLLTNVVPAREIPNQLYDCGDGFYNHVNRVVKGADNNFIRNAGFYYRYRHDDEHHWIVKHCRKGWDEYVGHKAKCNFSLESSKINEKKNKDKMKMKNSNINN